MHYPEYVPSLFLLLPPATICLSRAYCTPPHNINHANTNPWHVLGSTGNMRTAISHLSTSCCHLSVDTSSGRCKRVLSGSPYTCAGTRRYRCYNCLNADATNKFIPCNHICSFCEQRRQYSFSHLYPSHSTLRERRVFVHDFPDFHDYSRGQYPGFTEPRVTGILGTTTAETMSILISYV